MRKSGTLRAVRDRLFSLDGVAGELVNLSVSEGSVGCNFNSGRVSPL